MSPLFNTGSLTLLLVCLFVTPSVDSQDPLEVTSADTLIYCGWNSCVALEEPFRQTALGKCLLDPGIQKLHLVARDLLHKAVMEQAGNAPQAAVWWSSLQSIHDILRRSSGTFVLYDVTGGPEGPVPQAALCLNVGDSGPQLLLALRRLGLPEGTTHTQETTGLTLHRMDLAPGLPLEIFDVDGRFVVAIGDQATTRVFRRLAAEGGNLTANPRFVAGKARVIHADTTPICHTFVDLAGILERLRALAAEQGEPLPPVADVLLRETGADRVQGLSFSLALDGKGYRRTCFMGFDQFTCALPAVTDADLLPVPRDTSYFCLTQCDLRAWLRLARHCLEVVDPGMAMQVENQIQGIEENVLGFKVDDFFAALGTRFMAYEDPVMGTMFLPGLGVALKPANPQALHQHLVRLVQLAAVPIAQQTEQMIQLRQTSGTLPIHYVAVPGVPMPVTLAWAVVGDRMLFSTTTAGVQEAIHRLTAEEPRALSILANASYQSGRALLPENPYGIGYVDTAATVRRVYPYLSHGLQALASFAAKHTQEFDLGLLPAPSVACAPLYADVGGEFATEDGLLFMSHGPLPIALPNLAAVTTIGIGASLLVPTVSRARSKAEEMHERAQVAEEEMRRIVEEIEQEVEERHSETTLLANRELSILVAATLLGNYADAHDGAYPPSLKDVNESLSNQNLSFLPSKVVYFPGFKRGVAPARILMYFKDPDEHGKTVVLLTNLSHESMSIEEVQQRLAKQSQQF